MFILLKWNEQGLIRIGIHADDCLVIGKLREISMLGFDLKRNVFNLKVEYILKDYLSCQVVEGVDLKQMLILQPKSMNNLYMTNFMVKCFEKKNILDPWDPKVKKYPT
jgi:hypothetical protein